MSDREQRLERNKAEYTWRMESILNRFVTDRDNNRAEYEARLQAIREEEEG